MTDRIWFPADYSTGLIDGRAVVLVRGGDYPATWTRDDLPWRVHATCAGRLAEAREMARLLNEAKHAKQHAEIAGLS